MKINWKYLAMSPGYKSLKAAYIHDVQEAAKSKNPMRDKAEFLQKFYWVLNRAKHYSAHTGKPVYEILNEWEAKRDYWWLNYYQDCRQPKFHSNSKKPSGIKGLRKYYKNWGLTSIIAAKHRICKFIQEQHQKNSTKKKKRWTMDYKRRMKS